MSNKSNMKVGRTIAQEREKTISESERFAAREKKKKKQGILIAFYVIFIIAIMVLLFIGVKGFLNKTTAQEEDDENYEITAEVVDEANLGITKKTQKYIAQLEGDFQDLGYKVTRVSLPAGKSREIDVNLEGVEYYIKVNTDRGTAVSAEDADRMIRYIKEKELSPGYVDVRVAQKGYYK